MLSWEPKETHNKEITILIASYSEPCKKWILFTKVYLATTPIGFDGRFAMADDHK